MSQTYIYILQLCYIIFKTLTWNEHKNKRHKSFKFSWKSEADASESQEGLKIIPWVSVVDPVSFENT